MAIKVILRENKELTKSEIKDLIEKEVRKIISDEFKRLLKDSDAKNEISAITKDYLKKFYRDLGMHHTYIIDRIKV